NRVVSERSDAEGRKLTNWKFRPGQRLELRLPSQRMEDVIVLPAESLIQEGAERFVLIAEQADPEQESGEVVFVQYPVRVLYRDRFSVVLGNDGLPTGRFVVTRGSYQIHLAIRNRSGNALDPHAGHNH
ncbi:MAG: secretion protein HlyD, partial [Planctomycetia bacterium]|nr:secretion protein HlyD [Planctomycetia bacterium]